MPGTAFNAANWTGYDSQSFTATASHTDFTLLIDVSTFSNDWKGYVQSNGADIRITKSDGTTELAYDLIDWAYNAGAPTGHIRTLFAGASGTGANTIRVWAGYTGGTATAYADNETYGADNAYNAAWVVYYPDGGSVDRTSNGFDLTANGGYTAGGATGKVGTATTFDGTDDYGSRADNSTLSITGSYTLMAWAKRDNAGQSDVEGIVAKYVGSDNDRSYMMSWTTGNNIISVHSTDGTYQAGNALTGGTTLSANGSTWYHLAARLETSTRHEVFVNGSTDGNDTTSVAASVDDNASPLWVGNQYGVVVAVTGFDGVIDEVQVHSTNRADEWIADEYAQSNNNATWWGSWSWTAQSGGLSMAVAMHNYRRRRAH